MLKSKLISCCLSLWLFVSSFLTAFHSSQHSIDQHSHLVPSSNLPVFVAYTHAENVSEHSDHSHSILSDGTNRNAIEIDCLGIETSSAVTTHCDTCLGLSSHYLVSIKHDVNNYSKLSAPSNMEQNAERHIEVTKRYLTRAPPV